MRLRHVLLMMIIIGVAVECWTQCGHATPTTRTQSGKAHIQAVLVSQQTSWNGSDDIPFIICLANTGDKSIRVDGDLSWPGTVTLWAELPSGKTVSVCTDLLRMSRPNREDVVVLGAQRVIGARMMVHVGEEYVSPLLQKPKPGKYTFWASYYSVGNPDFDCVELACDTNRVMIEVQ